MVSVIPIEPQNYVCKGYEKQEKYNKDFKMFVFWPLLFTALSIRNRRSKEFTIVKAIYSLV